jgi:beta-lactam-binding protein with PASTA domain
MAPGTVIEAEPGPGSQVDENSVVRIVVATAPRPSPPRSSQTDGNG